MKLTNNITGEYQALPEEMFSKQVLFIQFTLWAGVKILRTSGAQTAIPFVCDLYKTIPVGHPVSTKKRPFTLHLIQRRLHQGRKKGKK